MEFFHDSSGPSDGASGKWTIAISRSSVPNREEGPPLDGDPPPDEDRAATHTWAFDENRTPHLRRRVGMRIFVDDAESRSLMKPRVRWWALHRRHLNCFSRTCCNEDRVDSGPRDLRRPDRIDVHWATTRPAQVRPCGNIVPHGEKVGK